MTTCHHEVRVLKTEHRCPEDWAEKIESVPEYLLELPQHDLFFKSKKKKSAPPIPAPILKLLACGLSVS